MTTKIVEMNIITKRSQLASKYRTHEGNRGLDSDTVHMERARGCKPRHGEHPYNEFLNMWAPDYIEDREYYAR